MDERALRVLEYDKIIKKLADMTASVPGREIAESLKPETELSRVEQSLKETSDGVSFIVRKGSPPMSGIHDLRSILKRVEIGAILNPGELLKVSDVLGTCRRLKAYSSESVSMEQDNVVTELINCLVSNKRVEDKIKMAVLNEEELADGASPALADIRRKIKDAQNSIKEKLNDLIRSSKYQKFMQEAIVTMRGDRYVIPVKQEYRSEIPGLIHDASASGATIFIEPMAVVEANNNIRQLKIKEQAEIERILYELTADVSGILDGLKGNVTLLAKLDFIFAKAKLSVDYKCVCPKLNKDGHIVIKKGRHPLLDPKTVVPIDFWIGDQFNTLVVTGPNTGGKTVTLKTVGLFTLMTQAGLHVPANEGTVMSVFEKVFADIGDEQSIEQSLSTFSSHMKNIVGILEKADDSSLVLFDELGAGTDPTEGAALAMAILECLHQTGTITVATTHYSELKVYAISTKGVENACCEFDVETLKPTYKLLIGVPGKSNAFAISKRLGLGEDIIERAKEFLTQEDIKFEDLLMNIEKNRSEAEKERIKAERYRIEIENLKKELEEQKKKLEQQKEKLLREAKEEARKILLNAKAEAEDILEEMRRIEKEQETIEKRKEAEQFKMKLKNRLNEIEDSLAESAMPKHGYVKPPENLKPGESVLIVNLNQKGIVINPPDHNGEALVQAGIMKINVHVTNLKRIDEQKEEIKKAMGIGKIGVSKARTISTEVDVRGQTLDEAIEVVDKYLDDAAIAGLKEISIIHGKGTGVLRSGIHQFLKTNRHVNSFRLGKYGEGETGVTIVELN
ncbi:endonuclease MutS2 [Clostridium thermosuccinogenes]|uniref:Endonuclease MutS2 n=1 Tax=Clostridium thermosuccinogenes TaxID=84032 RepID=A0A2K2F3D9_9CLOT|nr:endonuclease MutS2 [Pseudoclostridium thermosuccinogenes]AUS95985.1 endonuclease MutS2 [Pseudoclostridium thermosuccinogenes]PNT93292.1 endonuclease MutS2 [Pseudoclostridium thermosuccinogenes]PNT99374.1 endonuclease MutS2 [Pseudoclostridium thermosuccinogenes]PNU01061.1 endonuclease MutS2 [Pseudoclostridium thermosuccinogenes]